MLVRELPLQQSNGRLRVVRRQQPVLVVRPELKLPERQHPLQRRREVCLPYLPVKDTETQQPVQLQQSKLLGKQ